MNYGIYIPYCEIIKNTFLKNFNNVQNYSKDNNN